MNEKGKQMTIDDIHKYISRYDNRLTPELCLAIAQEAARREREACASLCLQGTCKPVQTHALKMIREERKRLYDAILRNGK